MSVYLPPSEYTPIFDANLFPSTPVNSGSSSRDATKLDYPIAQGAQTFPDGLTTTYLTTPSVNLSSSLNQQPIGFTLDAFPVSLQLQVLPNSPPNPFNSGISNLGVQVEVGGRYLFVGELNIQGDNGSNTGSGFLTFFVFNIVGTAQYDWFTSQVFTSPQNFTATTNFPFSTTSFSFQLYIDPAYFPSQNSCNVYLNTAGGGGLLPSGVWRYANSAMPSYIQIIRIA
jgi:hypothetical protein